MLLHQCVTRAMRVQPNQTATRCQDRVHSWGELGDRTARFAAALRSLGLAIGDRVAVLAANSDRYLEVFYAVSWAGGTLVPLNTRLNRVELEHCLADSGATLLIVDEELAELAVALRASLPEPGVVVSFDATASRRGVHAYERLLDGHAPAAPVEGAGGTLAGIFYTGGATGRPKGVMLSHDNLLANAWHILPELGWHPGTRFLHAAPMFHLADITCLMAIGLAGGENVIMERFDPAATLATIDQHRVTALGLVPTMIHMLVNQPDIGHYDLSSLASLLYGGSPMPEALVTRTCEVLPQVRLWQAYGQTEAAPILTLLPPERHHPGPGSKARSAGRAALGCEVSIREPHGDDTELPRGEIGEICGRGDNIMAGYWHRQEMSTTALRGGWLHTGDLGYLDEDGYLYVVDRLADMIITGGENVYSTEVENALTQHPAVAEAAVVGLPDHRWGERVHAVVTRHEGRTVDAAELLAHCRSHLAGYKCPRAVDFRDALPTTGAGKVDKPRLRDMAAGADRPTDQLESEHPST